MFAFLLDVILFIFVLILYYTFLMTPSVTQDLIVAPTSPRKGTLTYSENIDLAKKVIQVSGQTWNIVLDPDLYDFDSKKISLKHPCDNHKKGSWILAKPKDIYRHTFLKGQLLQHERYRNTFPSIVDTLNDSVDYFYECGEKYHRLRQCPLGTYFVRGQCFASNVCRFKRDRYKYTIHGLAETDYYECQKRKEIGPKTCPPGQIFRFTSCVKPSDPCHLEKDNHIVDSGIYFYKFCRKGFTITRYCGTNEYFHPWMGRCIPDTCRGKPNGILPGQTVTDTISSKNAWQYIKKYVVCKDGIVERQETCTRISHDETIDEDVDLPMFKVFDQKTASCQVPKFCVNMTTGSKNVSSTRFRRLMANYQHAHLYDFLNGYTCDNQRQQNLQHVVAAPGKLINNESVCDYDKTKTKFPIYGEWNRFFDCATNSPQDCSTTDDEIFDYGSQQCIRRRDSESFHKFDRQLPVFKFKDLHYNWIKPRLVRLQNSVTTCDDPLVYDETYDICVDKRCQGYEFLSQLDNNTGSSSVPPPFILADEYHQCIWDKSSKTVRYVPYQKPYDVKLDFWRQTLVPLSRQITVCEKGKTRLSTPNFVMNATVWPTCNLMSDLSLDKPFVFCPSTGLSHISTTMPTLCIPSENVLKIDLLAGEWYYVHITEYKFLHTFERDTSVSYKFFLKATNINRTHKCYSVGNYSFNDITGNLFPKNFHHFLITVDKNAQLWRYRVPTNHPEYVVDEEGNPSHENFDLYKTVDDMLDSKFTNVKDAKFIFENYSIDSESLTGFS